MADIFISYSKRDRGTIELLSAYLELQGWEVWWDRSLTAGDEFRDEITRQLTQAKAAIVVWSENSVRSAWVQSEAGRAQAAHKLIPVKTQNLGHLDIPPPFDTLHTEEVGALHNIREAVAAELAAPIDSPSVGAHYRYELLSLVGVCGCILTLLVNLDKILELANWTKWITDHWAHGLDSAWHVLLGWLHVDLMPSTKFQLTMALFLILMAVGSRVSAGAVERERWPITWRNVIRLNVAAGILIFVLLIVLLGDGPFSITHQLSGYTFYAILYPMYIAALFVGLLHWPTHIAIGTAISGAIFNEIFQSAALTLPDEAWHGGSLVWIGNMAAIASGVAVLYLAPPRLFFARILLVMTGITCMVGLSELSKLASM